MKKVLAILLALCVLALSGCAAEKAADTAAPSQDAASKTEETPAAEEDAQASQEAKRVEPLPESLDLNALTDASVAVSFGAEDVSEKDGKTEISLSVYDYDVYDMVDIAQLAVGDTIVVDGNDMVVTSREDNDGLVSINGGLEEGGVDLTTDGAGIYYAVGPDDVKSWHALGTITVPVADSFVLNDSSDLENQNAAYAASDLAKLAGEEPGFRAGNTVATIENGELTVMARSYMP